LEEARQALRQPLRISGEFHLSSICQTRFNSGRDRYPSFPSLANRSLSLACNNNLVTKHTGRPRLGKLIPIPFVHAPNEHFNETSPSCSILSCLGATAHHCPHEFDADLRVVVSAYLAPHFSSPFELKMATVVACCLHRSIFALTSSLQADSQHPAEAIFHRVLENGRYLPLTINPEPHPHMTSVFCCR